MALGFLNHRVFKSGACFHAGGAIVALGIGLALIQSIAYLAGETAELEQRRQEALEFASQSELVRARHVALVDQLRAVQSVHEDMLTRLRGPSRESQFLTQLSELAASAKLQLREFRLGQVAEFSPHKMLDVQVRMEGSYAGHCRFLDGLDRLPRLCRLVQMNLLAPQTPGENCSLELQLQLIFDPTTSPNAAERLKAHE